MATSFIMETRSALQAIERFTNVLSSNNISIEIRHDFSLYASIRHNHGDVHLNQAFDPKYTYFDRYDFWILARGLQGDEIATYCVRRFNINDFYQLIRTQALWFSRIPDSIHQQLKIDCEIPPFGGEIIHGGGL